MHILFILHQQILVMMNNILTAFKLINGITTIDSGWTFNCFDQFLLPSLT